LGLKGPPTHEGSVGSEESAKAVVAECPTETPGQGEGPNEKRAKRPWVLKAPCGGSPGNWSLRLEAGVKPPFPDGVPKRRRRPKETNAQGPIN
jgi:hypothetical protein